MTSWIQASLSKTNSNFIWRNPYIITQHFHCSKLQYRGIELGCVSTGYRNAHITTLLLKIPQEYSYQLPHQGRKSVFNLKIDGNIAFVYFARVLHPYNKLTLVCNGLYDLFFQKRLSTLSEGASIVFHIGYRPKFLFTHTQF